MVCYRLKVSANFGFGFGRTLEICWSILMARKIINIRNCFLWNHVVSRTIGSISHPIMVILRLKLSCRSTRGWKFLETESFSQLKVSKGWKYLEAESFSGLKVSGDWNLLRAESVFHSQDWKFLKAEIVSAESVSRLKVSFGVRTASFLQLKLSRGWKCLLDLITTIQCRGNIFFYYWVQDR